MNKLAMAAAALVVLNLPVQAFAQSDEPPSTPMEKAISGLPHDKAETFRDAMQSAHEENKDLYERGQQLRKQMHNILTAQTFDKYAFAAKGKQLVKVHEKIRKNLDDAFAEAASGLSADERQTLADALEVQDEKHKAMKKEE